MRTLTYSLLSMLALLPCSAFACMPRDGYEYKRLSEAERIAEADVVFIANATAMTEAPDMRRSSEYPYIYRVTMNVSQWVKGSGDTTLVVFDTGGTDCDFLTGVSHVRMPREAGGGASKWHVFSHRSQGQLWVIKAYPMR